MASQFFIGSIFNTDRFLAPVSLSLWTLFCRSSSYRLSVLSVVCTVLKRHGTAECNILHSSLLFFVWNLDVMYGEMIWITIYAPSRLL